MKKPTVRYLLPKLRSSLLFALVLFGVLAYFAGSRAGRSWVSRLSDYHAAEKPVADARIREAHPIRFAGRSRIASSIVPAETLTGEAAKEQLRKNGQYESLGAAFQAARYAVEKIDPAGPHSRGAEYFAANPKQQLRAWFSQDGVELASGRPTKEGAKPWNLGMHLKAAGRTGALATVDAREMKAEGSRIEMSDPAAGVTQWFENRKEGVEQGFTVTSRPSGSGSLEVLMSVEGTLHPGPLSSANDPTQDIHFAKEDGAGIVHYTGLKAWDSSGRELPAHMELRGSRLALLVADNDACYPVTIDPLFANVEVRLEEFSDYANAQFGTSVAVSGDTAVVGAPQDFTSAESGFGAAYVFVRNGLNWYFQDKLTPGAAGPPQGFAYDLEYFGSAVAISGTQVLVGAPYAFALPSTLSATGAAYIFVRTGVTGVFRQNSLPAIRQP